MKSMACYNMKGGVGKTSFAVNFAYLSAANGVRTMVWDLDPQGAATFHLGVEPLEQTKLKKLIKDKKLIKNMVEPTPYANLSVIPAGFDYRNMDMVLDDSKKSRKKLKKIISSFEENYDLFLFDCPPSISNLSEVIFSTVEYILMPVVPAVMPQQSFLKVKEYLSSMNETCAELIPFFNMVDRRKSGHRKIMWDNKKEFKNYFCENFIPARADVEKMGIERAPLHAFAAKSSAAVAYKDLWKEITKKTGLISEKLTAQIAQ
ncbi:AAA family ATPase [Maridesulfovibrio sp.]|uniref:ParA family protein n=1 Tax=Maridesulfovibrio sp. TaxID=2795000 RepID=UPI0029CA02B8|nr:AAA family ATPase [Maridesulfovibrio sp.]